MHQMLRLVLLSGVCSWVMACGPARNEPQVPVMGPPDAVPAPATATAAGEANAAQSTASLRGQPATGTCAPPNAAQAFASYAPARPNPPPSPPFVLEASEDVSASFPGAPRLNSFAFAQLDGDWVFIGGRTNGFHGFTQPDEDFPAASANTSIWVVTPAASGPAKVYSFAVASLPPTLDAVKAQWQATNSAFYQDGEVLYMAGGYGPNSKGAYVTFPLLSSVNLRALIQGVKEGKDTFSQEIAFAETPLAQTTGGELLKLPDGFFYVVMGQNFQGKYSAFENDAEDGTPAASQTYLKEVRKLRVARAGKNLAVALVTKFRNEAEFGRRDLNITFAVLKGGKIGIGVYGGVFTPDPVQLNYYYPIYFDGQGYFIDYSYEQKMSQYSCAKMVFYSASDGETYTTFFGGISRFSYDYTINQFSENPRTGSPQTQVFSDGMPWIDTITTLAVNFDTKQLSKYGSAPHGITTASAEQPDPRSRLPGYLGSEMQFIPLPSLKRYVANTEVFDYAALAPGVRTHIGFLYGGIEAVPCDPSGKMVNSGATPTRVNTRVLKVYATRPAPTDAPHPKAPSSLKRGRR